MIDLPKRASRREVVSRRERAGWPLLAWLLTVSLASSATAAEPHLEFLRGLRSRGYYDVALEYLSELAQRSDVPRDVLVVLPYERAVTLLEGANKLTVTKAKREQIDAAQAALEQFVQSAPDHPLVAEANTRRATIFKERALVELWDADDPANIQNRQAYQTRARELLLQARAITQQVLPLHEQAVKAFPVPIPEDMQTQHKAAENKYLQDLFDLAESTYLEAETYNAGSKQRNDLLEKAQKNFDDVWSPRRSQVVGLLSRLFEAKCFEEMGLIGEALGLYNELLKHPGTSEGTLMLKAKAQWFRLICLNSDARKDYLVVVQEATDWLNHADPELAANEEGLGIRFELARAQEALGLDRKLSDDQRKNWLSQALASAQLVGRSPGRFKGPALGIVNRVSAALGRTEVDPRNFNDAFATGSRLAAEISQQSAEHDRLVTAGDSKSAQALQPSLTAGAAEMTRIFDIALRLADDKTEPQQLAIARLQLAHGYFTQGKYYEAAVAAEYAAAHAPPESDDLARIAAFVRMVSYQNAYLDLAEANGEYERQQMVTAAEDIVARWPDSDSATTAREAIAKMYVREGHKSQAAEWWAKVPPTADEYAESQIRAGQAYWAAFGEELAKPETGRAAAEQIQQWRAAAEQHLVTGINAWQQALPADSSTPRELALGKLSLAQIRNLSGVYKTTGDVPGALEILTQPPHAVIDAVAVSGDEKRPDDPNDIRSAKMASLAYQQLLRTQIGLRDLDAADEARKQLEAVAAGDDSAALTLVYVAFGQELQNELQQLHESGQTDRLSEVRAGFEQFLDSISQREDGQTFGSLLWIAETYTSLAEGSQDDSGKAKDFFDKASHTYDRMAERAAKDEKFLTRPDQKPVISLRLADCRKRQGDYPSAEQAMLEAVRLSPQAPNVQFEAALLYRDWGAAKPPDPKALQTAIEGKLLENAPPVQDQPAPRIWGWNLLARRLQQALLAGRRDERVAQMHIDTRYYQADCLRMLANTRLTEDEQIKELNVAKHGIEAFARVSGSLPPNDFARFDALYRQIQEDLGEPVKSLDAVLAGVGTSRAPETQTADTPAAASTTAAPPTAAPAAKPAKKTSFALVLTLVAVVCAACIGLYVWSVQNERNKKKRSKSRTAARSSRVKTR